MALRWVTGKVDVRCRVCDRNHAQALVATVDVPWRDEPVRVARCARCSSIVLDATEPELRSYTDDEIDWYVEHGAGLEAIARTLAQVSSGSGSWVLDIGCGYGFALDIGARVRGWEGIGVDPSPAVERGKTELGLDLRKAQFDDDLDVGTRPFDVVMASEVLEHTDDPRAFLAAIRRRMAPHGVLVLSTPDAHAVDPARPVDAVLATLYVGAHVALVHAKRLRTLLRKAGFRADVRSDDGTLLAIASPSRLGMRVARAGQPADLAALQHYLSARAESAAPGSALAVGMAARALKLAVNLGNLPAAETAGRVLTTAVQVRHHIDITDPRTTSARAGEHLPDVLVVAHYYLGMIELLLDRDNQIAAEHFAAASAVAGRNPPTAWSTENTIIEPHAIGHEALARARFDPEAVPALFDRLQSFATPDSALEQMEPTLRAHVLDALVRRGALDVAEKLAPGITESLSPPASTAERWRRRGHRAVAALTRRRPTRP